MTQYDLVIEYIKEHGSIVPAKVGGKPYKDGFFGSETSKRCRELRAKGKLLSVKDGKFERFYAVPEPITEHQDYSDWIEEDKQTPLL